MRNPDLFRVVYDAERATWDGTSLPTCDETLEAAKEGAFREVASVDAAHARGELDEDGWHRAMAAIIAPSYLNAIDLRRGSGHTGIAEDWEWSRGIVMEAIDRAGSFLDVGCANGLLMESVERWGAARGLHIDVYGLDILSELTELARARVPRFRDRIWSGNALGWEPPRRFDFVRTCVDYVPRSRRRALVAWLLERVVTRTGRLIIGKYNEEIGARVREQEIAGYGFTIAGRADREHRKEPRLAYRNLWIDASP